MESRRFAKCYVIVVELFCPSRISSAAHLSEWQGRAVCIDRRAGEVPLMPTSNERKYGFVGNQYPHRRTIFKASDTVITFQQQMSCQCPPHNSGFVIPRHAVTDGQANSKYYFCHQKDTRMVLPKDGPSSSFSPASRSEG